MRAWTVVIALALGGCGRASDETAVDASPDAASSGAEDAGTTLPPGAWDQTDWDESVWQ